MIPILTPRGLVWLSSSLLIPLSGVVLGIPWRDVLLLFIVYWLVVGVAGLFWYVNERRFLKTLSLTGIVPAKCFSNRPEHFSILLRAAPRSYVMEWILTPTLRGEVHAEDLPCAIESPSQNPLCTTPFTINPFGRGEILWNSCAVRWGRKGGLLRFQASVSLRETCISTVYPNILAAQEGSMAMLAAKREGERMAIAVRGEGREFDSLRKYAVGDDPRKIEWKRSARSNSKKLSSRITPTCGDCARL